MLTPGQVTDELGVSSATVRRWAQRFERLLSPRTGKKRTYTLGDLDILRRVKDLTGQGLTLDEVDQSLEVVPTEQTKALINLPDIARAFQELHDNNARLQQQLDELRQELEAIKAFNALPWYKRIGKNKTLY